MTVRYMLLVYANEQAMESWSAEEEARSFEGRRAVLEDAARQGIFGGADALQPTSTATTVRVQSGKTFVTDGPFAETKEQLAGYMIVECKDLDEALEWAARIPVACGGCEVVEVRPIREIQPRIA
jgi:hypothetical protein